MALNLKEELEHLEKEYQRLIIQRQQLIGELNNIDCNMLRMEGAIAQMHKIEKLYFNINHDDDCK